MKVALIAFYVMDSTAPLAKHIAQMGIEVDLYSILPQNNQNTYVFDFLKNKQPSGFVDPEVLKKTMGKKLYNYFSTVNLKVFIYPDGRASEFFLNNLYCAYKLTNYLKRRKYDIIHILHDTEKFWGLLYLFLNKKKVVQTLHEVTSHESKTSKHRASRLKFLINNSVPIIFNSDISKKRFIDFKNSNIKKTRSKNNIEMIRFGLYETYQFFEKKSINTSIFHQIRVLNFGRIVPYKGVHFLIEAVKLLQDKYPIHLTIAGQGIPNFNFEGIKSYQFINRLLSSEEIADLIQECDFVVLPYISSSQSGIPMTVFAFNKPIITSNIEGFKEVVDHMETGMLVDNLNPQTLASAMEVLLKNDDLRSYMGTNIKKKYASGEFSWKNIAKKTVYFYKKQLNNI